MTSAVLYEFTPNHFNPYLKTQNITLLVVVFLDGHKTHLRLPLSLFCQKYGIIMVCLPANTMHFLQVLDVVFFFRSLKLRWQFELVTFRVNNEGCDIRKENIPRTLQKIFDTQDFASCGLYPLDANSSKYEKLVTYKVRKLFFVAYFF